MFTVPDKNKSKSFVYPQVRRDESAIDVYHGVEIKDPYRWLENPDSEETKAFVDAQNAISEPFIRGCPQHQAIKNRIKQIWNYPTYSCPQKKGGKYYSFMNTGLQNQDVYHVQDSLDAEPKVFFDPNTLSDDGTIALTNQEFSEDGSILAYSLSANGSDWNTIHFMNAKTGQKYPEILENVKFSKITWTHDNKGIFYSCYPDRAKNQDGSETAGTISNQKLYYHRVGTPQSEDVLVVEFPEKPFWRIYANVTDCGRWLIVSATEDAVKYVVHFSKLSADKEIRGKLELIEIIGSPAAFYSYIGNVGTRAIFKTNKNAPNYKLTTIDLEDFKKYNWSELIAEHQRNVLNWAYAVGDDKLVVIYMEDVKSVLKVYNAASGQFLKQIPTSPGTISSFSGDKKSSQIFYGFTSFLNPETIYMIDLKTEESPKVFRESKIEGFDANLYKTTQIFYPSKDGTRIPMFIISKKDLVLDGSSPCLLYGYGGFNISMRPNFSVSRIVFMQHLNGIAAVANIRGGGEYGIKWHEDGCIHKKQNVFDDFQYAAKYLIENHYTSSKKLTIEGESNGGLLVAACINQKPDLFGAAIAHVGVLDMLKYHKFTIGHAWISDYGSSDDPEQFRTLLNYSPLHNVKPPKDGGQYPATLLVTADHDDRVVPLHSLKMIATLQHEIGPLPQQTNPLMIMIEVKAGHGIGRPTSKIQLAQASKAQKIGAEMKEIIQGLIAMEVPSQIFNNQNKGTQGI